VRLARLPGVFQPHTDSRMLAACLRREGLAPGAKVLDLCTGSGLLALIAARDGASTVTAVDVSRWALMAVRVNARLNGVRVQTVHGDLFCAVAGQRFDVIASNPPYLPSPAPNVPRRGVARAWEAGSNGRAFIDRICDQASAHLRPGGVLLLVHSSVCGLVPTLELLSARGLHGTVVASHRGPLGPRLASRARWLQQRGLLHDDGTEELVVIRAQPPGAR